MDGLTRREIAEDGPWRMPIADARATVRGAGIRCQARIGVWYTR
jgi:hypothetical protein